MFANGREAANAAFFWPEAMRDPGFMPWFSRFCVLARSAPGNVSLAVRAVGGMPPAWVEAAQFVITSVTKSDICRSRSD